MNTWLIFALISPLCYAVANIFDKFILDKRVKNFYAYMVITGFFYMIPIALVWYFVGFPPVDRTTVIIVFLAGICYGLVHFLYYYVLTKYEVSRIVGLFYMYPAFVALLSFILINERLTLTHYLAILLAAGGAVFLGIERHKEKWRISHLFWIMLLASTLPALIDVADKYLLGKFTYWEVYLLVTIPTAAINLLPIVSRNVRRDLVQPLRTLGLIFIVELAAFGGAFSFLRAASVAPISIVSALSTFQPVFVFVFTVLASIYIPSILKEPLTRHALFHKVIGIAGIVIAAVILSVA